jgi:hypothetical protein
MACAPSAIRVFINESREGQLNLVESGERMTARAEGQVAHSGPFITSKQRLIFLGLRSLDLPGGSKEVEAILLKLFA